MGNWNTVKCLLSGRGGGGGGFIKGGRGYWKKKESEGLKPEKTNGVGFC